jgi:hypothetical protein
VAACSLDSFVPSDQPAKPLIESANRDACSQNRRRRRRMETSVAEELDDACETRAERAGRLPRAIADALAVADADQWREKAQAVHRVASDAGRAKVLLSAAVTLKMPPNWWALEGQGRIVRVEALPKGDPNDNDNLRKFADAVLIMIRSVWAGVDPEAVHAKRASSTPASGAPIVISLALDRCALLDVLMTLVLLLVAGA